MGTTPEVLSTDDVKKASEDLIDEIVNGSDDRLSEYVQAFVDIKANGYKHGLFRTWSANNVLLVFSQVRRRKANTRSLYAGTKQWAKLGRAVREEELDQPYMIFGPPVYTVKDPNAAQGISAAGTAVISKSKKATAAHAATQAPRVTRYCRPARIPVYDYTQTVSTDPDFIEPDWGVPLAVGDLDTLRLLVQSSPVPVHLRDLGGKSEHGYLDKTGITVNSAMGVGNQIWTMLHELAHHHLGHLERITSTTAPAEEGEGQFETRAVCEQEAGLAQFLAMKMLGLDEQVGNDITKAAGAYLRSWTKTDADGNTITVEGHKAKRKIIMARMNAGMKAADAIVKAYAELKLDVHAPELVPAGG